PLTPTSSTGCPCFSPAPHGNFAYSGYPFDNPPRASHSEPRIVTTTAAVTTRPTRTSSLVFMPAGKERGGERLAHPAPEWQPTSRLLPARYCDRRLRRRRSRCSLRRNRRKLSRPRI